MEEIPPISSRMRLHKLEACLRELGWRVQLALAIEDETQYWMTDEFP